MRGGRLLLIDDFGHEFGDDIGMMFDVSEASAILHTVLDILVDTLLL